MAVDAQFRLTHVGEQLGSQLAPTPRRPIDSRRTSRTRPRTVNHNVTIEVSPEPRPSESSIRSSAFFDEAPTRSRARRLERPAQFQEKLRIGSPRLQAEVLFSFTMEHRS